MTQLDKFKRRLIRSVARLRVEEKKPDKEVWEILSKEMGCDCGPLWDRMRALTIKKLCRLLVSGDCTETIANVARPSATDMLMFDLVLAHEDDVDVIGQDVMSEKATDCKALVDLFELVQEFSLEETPVFALAETWEEAVRYYETKGKRLTSPMLLQRRWYQLKELTRANFYKLWHTYRGNRHLWNKAKTDCSLTDLQVAVAERYPYVITKPFKKWDELIKDGLVVLPHRFEQRAPEENDDAPSGNEQDLVLLEPEVETIDLGLDSDCENERHSAHNNATVQNKSEVTAIAAEYDPNITIKTEPPDTDGLSNVKILETTHIPVEQLDNTRQDTIKTEDIDPRIALKNELLRNLSKCIESTDELIKQCDPQEDQCENVHNALNEVENQMENIINPCLSEKVTEQSDPYILKHDKAFDYFRSKIVEEMGEPSNDEETIDDPVQGMGRTDGNISRSDVTEDNINSSKSKQIRSEPKALPLTDVTIVNNGIDFVDDGIEYNEDDENKKMEIGAESDSSIGAEKQEDATPSIDLKLLMTPVIVTTRLDDMLAFKEKEFASVVGINTIGLVELESKPKKAVKEPIKKVQDKQEIQSDNESTSDTDDSINDGVSDDQRVKHTSYLFQKPKSRSYNPIQLCKNPDFNTRLKRLTFGFLGSERNRQFLSACKPATVDLHKAFEDKLVNGTLYLKRSVRPDFVNESNDQKEDQSVRTVSVVPSAMSVQTLIDQSKMNFQPSSIVSSIDLTSDDMTERNRVIHLPDITQVRRINQKLLTAEVPPIRVQNNISSTVTSSNLKAQPVVENAILTNEGTAEKGQKSDDCFRSNQEIDNNTSPLLSNLLVTHRPPSFPKSPNNDDAHLLTEESTPALNINTTDKDPLKRIGRPPSSSTKTPAHPDKPPRKPMTRTIYPYVSWNKPVVHTIGPLDDFLITHDTLLKILAKAKNLSEYEYINKTTINKKTQIGIKDTKGKQKEPDIEKNKQEETKKIEKVVENRTDTQRDKITKKKTRLRAKRGITKTICCWARAWIFKIKGQLLRLPKHMCPVGECYCCCKHELPQSKSKENYGNSEPIELSDDENDSTLTSVLKTIECVVQQQSVEVPVPKLRIYSGDNHKQNSRIDYAHSTILPTDTQNRNPVESVCDNSKIKSSVADNTLPDVVIADKSTPADVQGGISAVADDTVQNNLIQVETPKKKPNRICFIPEAKMVQRNTNNLRHNDMKSNFQVIRNINKNIPALISSPVSKKMYVKTVYSKPSQKPPSASMSTQTMNVPLLQNLSIEPEGNKSIEKSDVINEKQLVIDGTRPFTTPTTIVNKNTDRVVHIKACKVSSGNPIYVGKNKILLTTVKFPSNLASPKKENERQGNTIASKVVPSLCLPEGVDIALQPNGELACIVKPGVELDSSQISMLPLILEALKQQIDTQKPQVISDVINLSDDENDQKHVENKNTSRIDLKNVLPSLVVQTQEEKSSGGQLVQDIEKTQTEIQENCQENVSETEFVTPEKNMTAVSKVSDDSLGCSEESNREIISDNNENIREEINVSQNQGEDTLTSQTDDSNPTKIDEKRDEDQLCIKSSCMIQTENKRRDEDKLIDKVNSYTEIEAEKKKNKENSERSAGSRNLLSDLMEMSGISEEDIKTAPEESIPTLPAIINIDPANVANKTHADGNLVYHIPDLTPVITVAQLKYACEQNGSFFKLDFETGILVPLSVCLKNKCFEPQSKNDTVEFSVKETGSGDKLAMGIPANQNSSLVTPNNNSPVTSSTFKERRHSISVRRYEQNTMNSKFSKPITILRHVRPQSLLRNQHQNNTKAIKKPRKQYLERIEAKIDLVDSDAPMEEEYLINSDTDDDIPLSSNVLKDRIAHPRFAGSITVAEISDDSSDDEPLALKSKRMRSNMSVPTQTVSENVKNVNEEHEKNLQNFLRIHGPNLVDEDVGRETGLSDADSMELDTDIPTDAILDGVMPDPEEGDSFEYESSPEDSILGM